MRFTESHEWILVQGMEGTVGITKYAQQELGEVVFVALPKLGQQLEAGKEACVLESTKAAADVYSPVTGTVIAINENVKENPSLLNSEPESSGWLFKIKLTHPDELNNLISYSDYISITS